jgi:glycosyltransferase involved in cell wall biosynthesis
MRYIRDHLADYVIYQSQFVRDWWHTDFGPEPVPDSIIYNGVDTDEFTPQGESMPGSEDITLLSVEGELDAHQQVLQTPIETWRGLVSARDQTRLLLIGRVQQHLLRLIPQDDRVKYLGTISNSQMPYYLRSATVFISAEINPPCPNAVIEALACGTPVVGFATGSLPELVGETAGMCVDYRADPWKLERPDIDSLAQAAEIVASNYQRYSEGARRSALERFSLKKMVVEYLAVFERVMSDKVAVLKAGHA